MTGMFEAPALVERPARPSYPAVYVPVRHAEIPPKCDWCLEDIAHGLRSGVSHVAVVQRLTGNPRKPERERLCHEHATRQRTIDEQEWS